jgi:hypothetical protein
MLAPSVRKVKAPTMKISHRLVKVVESDMLCTLTV